MDRTALFCVSPFHENKATNADDRIAEHRKAMQKSYEWANGETCEKACRSLPFQLKFWFKQHPNALNCDRNPIFRSLDGSSQPMKDFYAEHFENGTKFKTQYYQGDVLLVDNEKISPVSSNNTHHDQTCIGMNYNHRMNAHPNQPMNTHLNKAPNTHLTISQ